MARGDVITAWVRSYLGDGKQAEGVDYDRLEADVEKTFPRHRYPTRRHAIWTVLRAWRLARCGHRRLWRSTAPRRKPGDPLVGQWASDIKPKLCPCDREGKTENLECA
jgi:hypothetical protein